MFFYLIATLQMACSSSESTQNHPENPTTNIPNREPIESQNILRLGIVPQQSPTDIKASWSHFANYIEEHSDLTVKIKTASNIPEFEKRCQEGAYDIAYMNPYHYVMFHDSAGYQAIAKQQDKVIKGIIVVHKDSTFTKLEDLQNMNGAFPSPLAFAASLLTRSEFQQRDINIHPTYVRTHDSVYMNVANGNYPMGGGIQRTFELMDQNIQDQLRILWITPPYTSHAIAVSPTMSKENIEKLQKIMLDINSLDNKDAILSPINFKGFELAKDEDWNDIRALHLEALDQQ